jgi:glycosyltransferase involved in cell wall biosynthesis
MPRALMITTHFLPHASGITTHVLNVASELVTRHGYKVDVLSPDFGGRFAESGKSPSGVGYGNFRSFAIDKSFCLPTELPSQFIRPDYYDIIHVHSYTSPMPLLIALHRRLGPQDSRCRYVLTPHYHPRSATFLTQLMRVPYDAFFQRFIFESFDGVVSPTEFEKAALSPFTGSCKHSIIPHGVDLDEMQSVVVDSSVTSMLKSDESCQLRAVFCGNLLKYKGVQHLLHAVSILKDGGTNVQLNVIGDGPYHAHLVELAQDLGIQSQVRFLGLLSRSLMLGVVKAADVLVLPSEFESFGIVLVEAMALGKAVIASDFGGTTSLGIPKEFLVRYGDSHGLASALNLLVSNRVDRELLGARYIQIVKEKYSWEQIGSSTADFYASL